MSDTIPSLRRKINSAGDLRSVVRTMKAMAASNIGQYEQSVRALADYTHSVELGLSIFFRKSAPETPIEKGQGRADSSTIGAVVFGSDQGLVGRFNDLVADYAVQALATLPGKTMLWPVGERVHARLMDAGLPMQEIFNVPNSVRAITPLIGQILLEIETRFSRGEISELYLFHNGPTSGAIYAPVQQRLLPLDENWRRELGELTWPTKSLPEIMGTGTENKTDYDTQSTTLRAFIREYLFVSLFRACAESLASENASRLAAMQRADKNINELLENLNRTFHRSRQSGIDEELFDVVSGFEALTEHK